MSNYAVALGSNLSCFSVLFFLQDYPLRVTTLLFFPTASMTNGSPRHNQSPMAARSNSAIDPSAVRRANVRAQYAQRSRMGVTVGASLRNNHHFLLGV